MNQAKDDVISIPRHDDKWHIAVVISASMSTQSILIQLALPRQDCPLPSDSQKTGMHGIVQTY